MPLASGATDVYLKDVKEDVLFEKTRSLATSSQALIPHDVTSPGQDEPGRLHQLWDAARTHV